jgi:hypothetical protein
VHELKARRIRGDESEWSGDHQQRPDYFDIVLSKARE